MGRLCFIIGQARAPHHKSLAGPRAELRGPRRPPIRTTLGIHINTGLFTNSTLLHVFVRNLVAALNAGRASQMPTAIAKCTTAKGAGPRAALQRSGLAELSSADKKLWVEEARLKSILGSSSGCLKSLRSGISCWITFVGTCHAS